MYSFTLQRIQEIWQSLWTHILHPASAEGKSDPSGPVKEETYVQQIHIWGETYDFLWFPPAGGQKINT